MASLLYVTIVVVLLLAAFAVCLPVMVEIVREGRRRREKWKSGELEPPTAESGGVHDTRSRAGERTGADEVACRHCGAANSVGYVFCQECTGRLD